MKTRLLFTTIVSFLSMQTFAQNFQDIVKVQEEVQATQDQEQLDDICKTALLGFTSTPAQVDNIVTQIIRSAGVKRSFELKECSNLNNAIAKNIFVEGVEKRYIIYDAEWLQSEISGGSEWFGKMVLAHEIGHHMNGHSMNEGYSTPEKELEADYFAGRALASMGATYEEAMFATEAFGVNATSSHPAGKDRREQIEAGFKSITNKALTLKVNPEDIDAIGLNLMRKIKTSLESDNLTREDYSNYLKVLNKAKNKYYKGKYTEDMRYYEAILNTNIGDDDKAVESYINYLSIENLDKQERIKQISSLFSRNANKSNAFFNNPLVVFQLSKANFKLKKYDKAISYGNQFLGQATEESKKSEINQLIADSEFAIIMSDEETGMSIAEMVEQGEYYLENADYVKAEDFFKKAAEGKNKKALYFLGSMYATGRGVTRDSSRATSYFLDSAEQGYSRAQLALGEMYKTGGGSVDKNLETALFWFTKAKEDSALATEADDRIFEIKKILRDEEAAAEAKLEAEREKAALDSATKAILSVVDTAEDTKSSSPANETIAMKVVKAESYFTNEMYADAYRNYIDAANSGSAKAQSRIAWMLYKGKGISKDKNAAYEWWRRAAKQGEVEAINYLTRLGKW